MKSKENFIKEKNNSNYHKIFETKQNLIQKLGKRGLSNFESF